MHVILTSAPWRSPEPPDAAKLLAFVVAHAHAGRGRLLLGELAECARVAGLTVIGGTRNPRLATLYKRSGCSVTERDGVHELELAPPGRV